MKAELNQSEIATLVGVQKSTVSREIRRNRRLRGYLTQTSPSTGTESPPHKGYAIHL